MLLFYIWELSIKKKSAKTLGLGQNFNKNCGSTFNVTVKKLNSKIGQRLKFLPKFYEKQKRAGSLKKHCHSHGH